jgi:hypothetical protein
LGIKTSLRMFPKKRIRNYREGRDYFEEDNPQNEEEI